MPTDLPVRVRRRPRPDYFAIVLVAIVVSFFVVEVVDPAPMDVEAALIDAAP